MFQCTGYGECTMEFSRAEHLARHIRKHTKERPFQCHCGRDFSRLDNVRQHASTVHPDSAQLNKEMLVKLLAHHTSLPVPLAVSRQIAAAEKRIAVRSGKRSPIREVETRKRDIGARPNASSNIEAVNDGAKNRTERMHYAEPSSAATRTEGDSIAPDRTSSHRPRSSAGHPYDASGKRTTTSRVHQLKPPSSNESDYPPYLPPHSSSSGLSNYQPVDLAQASHHSDHPSPHPYQQHHFPIQVQPHVSTRTITNQFDPYEMHIPPRYDPHVDYHPRHTLAPISPSFTTLAPSAPSPSLDVSAHSPAISHDSFASSYHHDSPHQTVVYPIAMRQERRSVSGSASASSQGYRRGDESNRNRRSLPEQGQRSMTNSSASMHRIATDPSNRYYNGEIMGVNNDSSSAYPYHPPSASTIVDSASLSPHTWMRRSYSSGHSKAMSRFPSYHLSTSSPLVNNYASSSLTPLSTSSTLTPPQGFEMVAGQRSRSLGYETAQPPYFAADYLNPLLPSPQFATASESIPLTRNYSTSGHALVEDAYGEVKREWVGAGESWIGQDSGSGRQMMSGGTSSDHQRYVYDDDGYEMQARVGVMMNEAVVLSNSHSSATEGGFQTRSNSFQIKTEDTGDQGFGYRT